MIDHLTRSNQWTWTADYGGGGGEDNLKIIQFTMLFKEITNWHGSQLRHPKIKLASNDRLGMQIKYILGSRREELYFDTEIRWRGIIIIVIISLYRAGLFLDEGEGRGKIAREILYPPPSLKDCRGWV